MIAACYHFHVTQVKRSAGQSVTEMAAYRACAKLRSAYYNETYNYTSKPGLIHSEILLPPHAPAKFADRETLWDAVEYAEKRPDAQLAFNFDFSLQTEFTNEENIALVQRFLQEHFISRGMICDWAFHYPTEHDDNPNPHVHLLCPMRPLNSDGSWGEKQKAEPVFDENGKPVFGKNGRQKTKAVKTTDWSDASTLIEWREAWAKLNNQLFEKKGLPVRISADTLEAQGVDRLPTIHEGPSVRAMESKGIVTERGSYNRWVRIVNGKMELLKSHLARLVQWAKDLRKRPPKEKDLIELLDDYRKGRDYGAYSQKAKVTNLKHFTVAVEYLRQRSIHTPAELEAHIASVQAEYDAASAKKSKIKKQVEALNADLKTIRRWEAVRPIGEQYEKKKMGKDKFYREHEKEIKTYFFIKKNKQHLINGKAEAAIKKRQQSLKAEQKSLDDALDPIDRKLHFLKAVRHSIDVAMGKADNVTPVEIEGETVFVENSGSVLEKLGRKKQEINHTQPARQNEKPQPAQE